jgi:spectinomycin phosphotransferase
VGAGRGILGRVMTKLRQWISDDYGLEVTELTPVDHGADVAAAVWQAEATTGDRYAVKWSGAGTDAGPLTAAYLASRGVRGVPAPLQTRTGDLWSKREGKRLSLVPWINGRRAAESGLFENQWSMYGTLLAEVHATAPPADLCEALPRLSPISARMPAQLRSVEHRLTTEPPLDALEEELATVWRERRGLITDLLHLADELASKKLGGDQVICHADPHLGNVLVTAGTDENNVGAAVEPTDWQLHLIDWDDVILAPREQDLMFMLGGMGSVGPTTEAQLSAFFTGYGEVNLDADRLTYYRCARALEDAVGWADQAIHGPDREDCLRILRGVLGPHGLAVRALS